MRRISTLVIVGMVAMAGHFTNIPANGDQPCKNGGSPHCEGWPAIHCGCCPDTYCVKRLPPVPCLPQCCSGYCYCAKPLPPVPCLPACCACDCYQVKPLPPVPKCCEPWYRCLGCGCKPGGAKTR